MGWIDFKLGRPGYEITFDVPSEAIMIEPMPVRVIQRNLAGDLKKSILKADAPTIRLNSSYLTMPQRNQFASLMGVADTFLAFICRDDWQVVNEKATVIDTLHLKLANSSGLRLSAAYVDIGLPSIVTITTPFNVGGAFGFGLGSFGSGNYGLGGLTVFDPGSISYDDATRIITLSNALPSATSVVFVSYSYPGWLVEMSSISHKGQGGWLDRFTYDIELMGA